MKKIFLFIWLFAVANSFAVYLDVGLGVGTASTFIDDENIDDYCDGCSNIGSLLNFRIGGRISEKFWLTGSFEGFGNRYYDSDSYIQFNSYLLGPSFIFYPVEHLHLSGSIGLAWTANDTDISGYYLYDGKGIASSLTAAYDTGINHGALIGMKLFVSSVQLDENEKVLSSVGLAFFVAFVRK